MQTSEILKDAIIFLAAAAVSVPISKRLGLGSVLGYLIAGICIGPWVFGFIKEPEDLLHFSEFGVVMFLFIVGLELKPKHLWQMRRDILGSGLSQVVLTSTLIGAIAFAITRNLALSAIIGMGLSLSSTALALAAIQERNILSTPAGKKSFSILLFQDISVIPMLALIPMLAPHMNTAALLDGAALGGLSAADLAGQQTAIETGKSLGGSVGTFIAFSKVFAVIGAIIIFGRLLTRPIFRIIASSGVREIFTATSLLLVIGVSVLMDSIGMSMALGTFLAGVILSESEYRHELESSIDPFKSILLGLFFISVGMSLNPESLFKQPFLILLAVAGFILLKMSVLFLIGKISGLENRQNLILACLISQASEFAFVLFGLARTSNILDSETHAALNLIVTLSLLTTPLIMIFADKLLVWLAARAARAAQNSTNRVDEIPADLTDAHVLIAGFGRFGQIIARLLHSCHFQTTVLDHDPSHIEMLRKFGFKVYYGDAARLDLLESAGLAKAKIFVCAIDDPIVGVEVIKRVREHYPEIKILARCRNLSHYFELRKLDVTFISRETFPAALETGEEALKILGFTSYHAHVVAKRFRKRDEEGNSRAFQYRQENENEGNFFSYAKNSRKQLEEQLIQENTAFIATKDTGWG